MSITITNNDSREVALGGEKFRDELLVFAAADTFAKGTLLARQKVATAITPTGPVGTGNGTLTLVTVTASPDVPKVGNWVLRNTAAVANGGVWRLEDPDGAIVATGLTMTPGAGGATAFEVAGLAFTLTDGSTDFAAGDTFTMPVVADGKVVPFNPAGAAGAQVPTGVLTYPVTRTSGGNEPVRMLTGGDVDKGMLIIDVDGDGDNITNAILDQLRNVGIFAVDRAQLNRIDNPQS